MKFSKLILLHVFLGICHLSFSQTYKLSNHIPVTDMTGDTLKYAWAGGNNNIQFSDIDLNLDGKMDLVVFNRDGESFSTYLNTGTTGQTSYQYAPEYISNFDSCKCIQWALLEDYNMDGRVDVICGASSGEHFQVYENIIYGSDSVGFEQRYKVLMTVSSGFQPLYQDRTDIPAIVDVDYDGDLDVIASQSGFNLMAHHKNMSMENYGTADSMEFVKESFCWGHFIEDGGTNQILVADTTFCPRGEGSGGPGGSRHSGTSLLVFEANGDSLMELLIGDISYPTANFLVNNGEITHAFMDSVQYRYPQSDSAIDVQLFPAFFHLDINNDQIRDLVIAPNEPIIGENIHGAVTYLNFGQDNDVDFRFEERGFIVSDHIDMGEKSSPVFLDYNLDGLKDILLLGGITIYKVQDTFTTAIHSHLYENVGSAESPAFQLVDIDFLGLDGLTPQIFSGSPAIGDVDGDGDVDLFVGNTLGTIYFFQNTAATGMPANFVLAADPLVRTILADSIDVGSLSRPELYDIDADGDLDLFVGNSFGKIFFYQNNGDSTSMQLSVVSNEWGFIKESNQYGSVFSGAAKPHFMDIDDDGDDELLVGSESGTVSIYQDFANALTDTVIRNGFLLDDNFGWFSAPASAVIDTSGLPTLIIGDDRGGLQLVSITRDNTNPMSIDLQPELPGLRMYPNPTQGKFTIEYEDTSFGNLLTEVQILSPLGQDIFSNAYRGSSIELDLQDYAEGVYIVRIRKGQFQSVRKLVLTKR